MLEVPSFCIKNIINIPKIDPEKPNSFNFDEVKYTISIKQIENSYFNIASLTNHNYNAPTSNYYKYGGDSRYGAVGNGNANNAEADYGVLDSENEEINEMFGNYDGNF
jgi:hypothetical protein